MSNKAMICSYCGGTVPETTTVCPDCQEDLSALARLEYGHAIYYNQALALAREGDLEQARTKLLMALELRESFAPAHVLMAKVSAQQGRWQEAGASAARAAQLLPDDEGVRQFVEEVARGAAEDEASLRAEAEGVVRARRANAERQLARYQRDVARAFGLGAGLAALLSLVIFGTGRVRGRD